MLSPKIIALEEGWNNEIKAKAIDVLEDMLNTGLDKNKPRLFDPKEYVQTYTTCYNMCTQRSPYNWSEQLYQRHGETICDYLSKTVLPALKQKSGNALLTELTVRWSNHKIMNKWMRLFFMYLDRYYVKHHSLPTLDVAGLKHFKTLVYNEVKKDVVNAMIALIDAERDQALIDRALVKNTVELLEAMGMGSLDAYVTDFEDQLLASTKEYYARKSQEWVESDDAPAYLAATRDRHDLGRLSARGAVAASICEAAVDDAFAPWLHAQPSIKDLETLPVLWDDADDLLRGCRKLWRNQSF